jgi:hypothetical protein
VLLLFSSVLRVCTGVQVYIQEYRSYIWIGIERNGIDRGM